VQTVWGELKGEDVLQPGERPTKAKIKLNLRNRRPGRPGAGLPDGESRVFDGGGNRRANLKLRVWDGGSRRGVGLLGKKKMKKT